MKDQQQMELELHHNHRPEHRPQPKMMPVQAPQSQIYKQAWDAMDKALQAGRQDYLTECCIAFAGGTIRHTGNNKSVRHHNALEVR